MLNQSPWSFLPDVIRAQALARYGLRQLPLDLGPDHQRSFPPGLGDGFVYHWTAQEPPAGYCGPLPFGQLIRRTQEV
jgi:hypothetical protein